MGIRHVVTRYVCASGIRRVLAGVMLSSLLAAEAAPAHAQEDASRAFTLLRNRQLEPVGIASFQQLPGKVLVQVLVWQQPPGFHGFHLHEIGRCDAPEFTTAGGHYDPEGAAHPRHAGDFPTLLVLADGTGSLGFWTDRFQVRSLLDGDDDGDGDGTALMVHELPNNYANIPERYLRGQDREQVDATTLDTGDAGGRIACGVVQRHPGLRRSPGP